MHFSRMTDRKKMQTVLSENWYETTEDAGMVHVHECSLIFGFL